MEWKGVALYTRASCICCILPFSMAVSVTLLYSVPKYALPYDTTIRFPQYNYESITYDTCKHKSRLFPFCDDKVQ